MKRNSLIILVALALMALLISTYSQTPPAGAVKKIPVTSQTLASLQAGKPYVIDLSRKGTVYNVASGVDYNRIQVRNSAGKVMTLNALFNKAGSKAKMLGTNKPLVFGTVSDLRALNSARPASRGNQVVACDGSVCICTGDDDCGKLLSPGGGCPEGSYVYCSGSGTSAWCVCIR
jgi:hypothetical protein